MELLIGTKNTGKVIELKDLLQDLPVRLRGLDEFSDLDEIEETGSTFTENADLKAVGYAAATGLWSLADDSGLEVNALNGAPGIYSARYGTGRTDRERLHELLNEIGNIENASRKAQFICSMTIADGNGLIRYRARGICKGEIARTPSGSGGFGYDPIFIPDGFDKTFGELPANIKRRVSHRARAIGKIFRYLRDITA